MSKDRLRLKHDQTSILTTRITGYIQRVGAKSLLDIGAGLPVTAVRLARCVTEYTAIEQDVARASILRASGLRVIVDRFPFRMDEKFDMVLSSHSVPEKSLDEYETFFRSADSVLRGRGLMLVITFKGSRGSVADLREEITGQIVGPDPQLHRILVHMSTMGKVRIRHVDSHLHSDDPRSIVDWLTGYLLRTPDEVRLHSRQLISILEARYRHNGKIVFPLQHLFLSVRKK